MVFNRFEAKASAQLSIRNASPRPIWVTAVYLLITIVLSSVILGMVGDSFVEALYYLSQGYDPEEVFLYVFVYNIKHFVLFIILNILFDIFMLIMSYGYAAYALKVARNQPAGFQDLFVGFTKFGRVLWMNILISLFSTLWSILCIIPAVISIVLFVVLESAAFLYLYMLLLAGGALLSTIITLRYQLAPFFMLDDPDCTAREAINRSKEAMKGHVFEYFVLLLSFIGWMLLCAITMGIMLIWVMPYMEVTLANFYEAVRQSLPSYRNTSYTSHVYDFDP